VGTGPITAGDVPEDDRPPCEPDAVPGAATGDLARAVRRAVGEGTTLRELRESVLDLAARAALNETGGNVRRAAACLGITERALQLRRAAWRQAPAPPSPRAPLDEGARV